MRSVTSSSTPGEVFTVVTVCLLPGPCSLAARRPPGPRGPGGCAGSGAGRVGAVSAEADEAENEGPAEDDHQCVGVQAALRQRAARGLTGPVRRGELGDV